MEQLDLKQIANSLISPDNTKPNTGVQPDTSKDRADDVPGLIDGEEVVNLSEGEFIIPADVVRAIGKGSVDAGSQILQSMVNSLRSQGSNSNNISSFVV